MARLLRTTWLRGVVCLALILAVACGSNNNKSSVTQPAGASASAAPSASATKVATAAAATSTAAVSPAAKAPTGQPIKLGLIVALTGPQASLGDRAKKGAELAADLINQDGGVLGRPIQIVAVDSQAKPDEAVKRLRELADQGVKLTFGYTASSECLAVVPVAEQLGSLVMSSYCQVNALTGENFSKNFFRVTTDAEMLSRAPAQVMAKRFPDLTKWATVVPDYAYGHNVEGIFLKQMKQLEPNFAAIKQLYPPFQSSNYQDYITQLQAADPQAVMTALYAGDLLTFLKQAKPYNVFKPGMPLVLVGGDFDALIPLGKDVPPDVWDSIAYYYKSFDNPVNNRFVKAYQEKYNTFPIGYDATTYNSVLAYTAAIKKAGSADVDKVQKALEGLTFDSLLGPTTIRPEDHQAIFDKLAVIHIIAAPDEPMGFKVQEVALVNGADVTSPPNPGKKNPYD
jgi:branched-chain amino acid transport system substrate-binding protein